MRNENMILAGLWFGDRKPLMSTFLRPLQDTMSMLNDGVELCSPERGRFICKAYLLAATADLPAKCLLCNAVQYNGSYSCWKCEQPGETAKVGKGHAHIFPYNKESPNEPKRTRETVITNAKKVVEHQKRKPTATNMGIKAPSWLLLFPKFDIIKGISIDYMHGVLLGVQKLIRLWFTKEFSGKPYNFYDSLLIVDKRLKSICPTTAITRLPRSIANDLKYWKASEFRFFLLFYGAPVLNGILDGQRFQHYLNFVNSIHILLKYGSTENDLQKAERMIFDFCLNFSKLYSKSFMTLNVHQLVHLPDCVRELGPLCTHSCFSFEDKNGYVLKLIKGTQNIDNQIVTGVSFIQKLPELKQNCLERGSEAEKLYHLINSPTSVKRQKQISDDIYVLGAIKPRRLDNEEFAAVGQYLGQVPHRNIFDCFKRILIRNEVIYGLDYARMINRNNASVKYFCDREERFGQIRFFIELETKVVALVQVLECKNFNSDSFILKVKKSDKLQVISVDKSISSCMLVDIEGATSQLSYVCLFPNTIEMD